MCIFSARVTYRFLSLLLLISFFCFNVFIVITVLTIPLPLLLSVASDSLPYVRKPLLLRKIPVGRPRLTLEDNIKMELKNTYKLGVCVQGVSVSGFVNTLINLQIPQKT